MKQITLAVTALAALLAVGCNSNEAKKDEAPAPTAAAKAETAPPPQAAKPACPAEPAKPAKKGSKSAKNAKAAPPPADCEPAKPKAASGTTAAPAPAPEPEPAAKASSTGKACNPCTVKSKDGSFDGEVYGTIPPGSKWAKLQIGMHQSEVERILGVSHNVRAYVTGKAFIPFYFGSDRHRYEVVYAGQGSVAYTGGSFGGGMGVLMMINYDAKIQ